jgi:hypothetical protein
MTHDMRTIGQSRDAGFQSGVPVHLPYSAAFRPNIECSRLAGIAAIFRAGMRSITFPVGSHRANPPASG